MPTLIKRLTPDGLVDVSYGADTLRDAAKHEPKAGVYTVSNSFQMTRTLLLGAHLDRLEDSARREGIALALDRESLRKALREMVLVSGFGDVRFRISVPSANPDCLTLTLEPYQPPSEDLLRKGARCLTTSAFARRNPAAKSSEWMSQRETLLAEIPSGIYEVFLVDKDGAILEGTGSNFYAIRKGELLSAPTGVLAGISRRIVYAVCGGIVAPRAQAPRLADLPYIDEAFLTSSSRGIIPVVEIDGIIIGNGRAGPRTNRLRQAYDGWVAAHLEEL